MGDFTNQLLHSQVHDFNSSFQDGRLLCALIGCYHPTLLPYSLVKQVCHTHMSRLLSSHPLMHIPNTSGDVHDHHPRGHYLHGRR